MRRTIEKAFPYLLLAPTLLPLVYFDGLLYPYLTPKTILLRAFGILLAAAFAFLLLSGREFFWARLKQKVTWIPAGLLLVAYGTSLAGVDFYHSFWSIFDRGDGLLTLSVIVAYFYAVLLFAEHGFFERLCKLAAWVGSLIALYTALQWLQGTSGLNIPIIAEPNGRYGGTLGNAAFLAAYLGLTFFLTLIVAPEYRGKWRTALYVGAALQILAVLVSATRGTLLALLAAAGVATLYLAWKGEGRMRTYARVAFVTGLIASGLFFAFRAQLAQVPIEPVRRVASISLADSTVESRVFIWKNMLSASLDRPLTGVGAEHVGVLFNQFYDPTAIVEQWFDRSHNVYLDYLVQYGIFGLALFLSLILAFAWTAFKLMREDARIGGLLLLLIITYALQNFFVFDTASTLWLLVVVFAAMLVVRSDAEERALAVKKIPWLPETVGVLILLLIIPVSLQPLRANIALARGYVYHVADARRAVGYMEGGLALGTYADMEYGYQLYQMYTDRQATMISGEARLIAYRFAAETLGKNFERYPYDARTATYYAHVLDTAPPEIAIDETRLREVIERAIELSPKRIQPRYLLANISLRKGDQEPLGSPERARYYREGIEVMEEYGKIVPTFAEPRYVIATLYQDIGDLGQASEWAAEGRALYKSDLNTARRAARYYITIEDWENAAFFMQEVVNTTGGETDYPALYDLAKTKWLAGDKEGARALIERIKEEAPGLFESDPAFVQEYEAAE